MIRLQGTAHIDVLVGGPTRRGAGGPNLSQLRLRTRSAARCSRRAFGSPLRRHRPCPGLAAVSAETRVDEPPTRQPARIRTSADAKAYGRGRGDPQGTDR